MTPPRVARRLLSWVTPREDRAALLSDLREEFESLAHESGVRRARRWYRGQAVRSLLPLLRLRMGSAARDLSEARREGTAADLARDVRTALRVHRKSPVVSAIIVVSLALGIGAATSVFSFSRAVLLPPSGGVQDTEDFVAIYTSDEGGGAYGATSFPDFLDLREAVPALRQMAAVRMGVVETMEDDHPRRMMVELVTGDYFSLVGVSLPLGRAFRAEETRLGSAERVVVLGHHTWTTRYNADPGVLGREIPIDGQPFTVVGVAPESLRSRFLQLRVDAWLPLGIPGGTYHATESELQDRRDREYLMVARTAPGVSSDQLQGQLDVAAANLRAAYPTAWTDDRGEPRRFTVLSEAESRVPPPFRSVMGAFSLLLLAGTTLVLLVACSNVAGLLLARAHSRTREMAIRVSLGASRGRIIRMLLVEGLLLAVVGGGLGIAGAVWSARRLRDIPLPGELPTLSLSMAVDWPVVAFASLVAVAAALLFGLAPALEAARAEAIRPGSDGLRRGSRRSRLRRGLVTVQVAGSVIFLSGGALVFRSLASLEAAGSGLRTGGLAVVSRELPEELSGEDPVAHFRSLSQDLLVDERVGRVALASVVEGSPFADLTLARVQVAGQPDPRDAIYNAVDAGYAELVGLEMVAGRSLTPTDTRGAPAVAVVNESFARRFWPDRAPVGQRFTILERRRLSTPEDTVPTVVEVVGVARDVLHSTETADTPFFWVPMEQFPVGMAVLLANGPSGPGAVALAMRQRIPAPAGQIPLVGPGPHAEVAALGTLGSRLAARGLGLAAAFVLGLALVGLAGLVSFSVNLRLPEMALRKALGAGPSTVVGQVIRDALAPVWWGTVLGLLLVVPAAYLARGLLFGISPLDPVALGGSLVLLLLATVGTSLVPALRAGRADPNRYLKAD